MSGVAAPARRVILWNLMMLDGFFEGPRSWELDWHEYVWGEELKRFSLEQLDGADMLLFGRITYEGMAAYWQTAEGEVADRMNRIAKTVFSRTLPEAGWSNTTLVRDDAADGVARLKAGPGRDVLIFGSADLSATLMRSGLIDEYRIGPVPVVLGGGTPLFKPDPERRRMELLEAKPLGTGCVILSYRPDAAS